MSTPRLPRVLSLLLPACLICLASVAPVLAQGCKKSGGSATGTSTFTSTRTPGGGAPFLQSGTPFRNGQLPPQLQTLLQQQNLQLQMLIAQRNYQAQLQTLLAQRTAAYQTMLQQIQNGQTNYSQAYAQQLADYLQQQIAFMQSITQQTPYLSYGQ